MHNILALPSQVCQFSRQTVSGTAQLIDAPSLGAIFLPADHSVLSLCQCPRPQRSLSREEWQKCCHNSCSPPLSVSVLTVLPVPFAAREVFSALSVLPLVIMYGAALRPSRGQNRLEPPHLVAWFICRQASQDYKRKHEKADMEKMNPWRWKMMLWLSHSPLLPTRDTVITRWELCRPPACVHLWVIDSCRPSI